MIKRNIEAIYPLSPMQQGMVFHSLHAPGSGVYCEQLCCTLRGQLDVAAFRIAWERVADRHATLRTGFVWKRVERMLQVVQRSVDLPFEFEDWRSLAAEEQEKRLESLLVADRKAGFNLAEAPLIRLSLKQIADDAHYFVLSFHHAVLDGWSFPIVLREVFAIYEALRREETLILEDPTPYQSYITWLQRQDAVRAEEFWRGALKGFTASTPLAIGGRPGNERGKASRYEKARVRLSAESTNRLQSLVREHRLTTSTLVQAAWGLLLSRYSGEDDVLFGATVAGRPAELPGIETMVGLFINTLPVRVRVQQQMRLGDWLKQLRDQLSEIRNYEHSSLVQIHGWSDVPRGVPLFESLVVFENYPVDDRLLSVDSDLRVEGVRSIEQTNYPLTIVSAPEGELPLTVQYDAERFEQGSIQRLLRHLGSTLEAIPEQSDRPLSTLPLLTPAERNQLIVEWNRTVRPYPHDRRVHQLFEEQVALRPDAIALESETGRLSYAELNDRANQLAHYLLRMGLGSEALVGICMPRSMDAIVSILAVLKAGYAYVPLDPAYPKDRLAFMLADSGTAVILTLGHLVEGLPAHSGRSVLVDEHWAEIAEGARQNPGVHVHPDQLAYVIYTSGSTGRPKGTLLRHLGLSNLTALQREVLRIDESSRVIQFSSLSFDASVWEIFSALIYGATLYVPSDHVVGSVPDLQHVLGARRITLATLPPSVLTLLETDGLDNLRTLLSAGEECSEKLVRQWAGERRFLNGYGPTEATVCATLHECSADENGGPPIGRPVANIAVYILDSYQRPVPVGVPGELCIGGAGVARGYHNRPGLTADSFRPDPFSGASGARLYRTGDLARYREDGNIEYLGRIDHQVKIRGFRVELGEIEAVLRQQPNVRDAVVIARGDNRAGKQLVAYLIADRHVVLDIPPVRQEVASRLPDYMVPSAFVQLESFPLTPNGKIDRTALPAPTGADVSRRSFVPPRTPLEIELAAIWANTLGLEQVGVHDDFHELGGHSLLATQLISRIRETFQVELPIADLFESPTIAGLASRIEVAAWGGMAEVPPIEPVARDRAIELSFAQQRLWFLDQLVPNSPFYNVPMAVRIDGDLNPMALLRSLQEIIRRHDVLRTTIRSSGGKPEQVVEAELDLPFIIQDLEELPEAERETAALRMAQAEAERPFDLEVGPLLRVLLVRLNKTTHLLVLTLHHIIADGWSLGVLVRELGMLYRALSAGRPSPLPPLKVQYGDFASWQRDWLQGQVLQRQLDYWKKQLQGSCMLDLPTDRPRPAVQSWRGATEQFGFSRELSEKLRALSRREGVTLFMTLLGAFQLLLSRYAGQEDVSVGTAIANRRHPETEDLIGFFVNTLVMRTDLSGNPTFREVLRRVREVALGAYAHQDVPFEMLVDELRPVRDMSHTPLFQVTFALQNAPFDRVDLPGLSLRPFEVDSGTSKFDMSVYVAEGDEGLAGSVEYNVDLFDAVTVRRLAGHLERLLEEVVSAPERRVGEVEFLLAEERERLVRRWNETAVAYESEECAHERFEARVAEKADAVAVRFEGEELSYGELEGRANRLARYLMKLGVGRGDLVALSVERGLEMVVGVLGVLKAGAAYVPVDPSYPAERVAYMLEDSGAGVVLTQSHLVGGLPLGGARAVCLDGEWEEIAREEESKPEVEVGPEDVAYVIYTSGSTGRPKGTVLSHGGLVNLSEAQREAFGIGEGSRVLQFAPLSFDASVWETVMALGNGGTLSVMRQEVLASVSELGGALREEGVTTVTLPPSVLGVLEGEGLPELRTVVAAGEACSLELVRRWGVGGRVFFNAYGPTETTVCASMYRCRGDEEEAPPIGRPLANMQLYVLDGHQRLVPEGVPGELCVGGVGLAQGYLRRPELTAEKFIPDAYSGEAGARLYRTGDLVRYRRDGNLEFLGRIDHQVKLRGFRIELGEIEAILESHAAVREAVVSARTVATGDERLVAYVTAADPEAAPSRTELRDLLKAHLPGYMLPSAIMVMSEFPLTPAGKVDRRALPAPDAAPQESSVTYIGPTTELERGLVQLFAELLGTKRVGINDDFFELGGHSLLATQLVSQVRERFQVELPLRAFFEAPTAAGLSRQIESAEKVDRQSLDTIDDSLTSLESLSEEEVLALLEKKRAAMGSKSDEE